MNKLRIILLLPLLPVLVLGIWQRLQCTEDCSGSRYFTIQETGHFRNPAIRESSGLCSEGSGHFLTHNDDTDSCLYRTDFYGNDLGKFCIPASNRDWEEICRAADGRIFLGDFGNNLNHRKDLSILLLDASGGLKGKIQFVFEEQQNFPPINPMHMNFDCEAMVFHRDSLWLFTKNRLGLSTDLYVLPAIPGKYTAQKIRRIALHGTVTGASLRPDGRELALLVYRKIYFFSLKNSLREIGRPDICLPAWQMRQTEAICYAGKDSLLMSNEQGSLYLIKRK
jgi:hypothetical protein